MSYLRYLCMCAHSGVQHIMCCVFCFARLRLMSYVPIVASFSGLSIMFGFRVIILILDKWSYLIPKTMIGAGWWFVLILGFVAIFILVSKQKRKVQKGCLRFLYVLCNYYHLWCKRGQIVPISKIWKLFFVLFKFSLWKVFTLDVIGGPILFYLIKRSTKNPNDEISHSFKVHRIHFVSKFWCVLFSFN